MDLPCGSLWPPGLAVSGKSARPEWPIRTATWMPCPAQARWLGRGALGEASADQVGDVDVGAEIGLAGARRAGRGFERGSQRLARVAGLATA